MFHGQTSSFEISINQNVSDYTESNLNYGLEDLTLTDFFILSMTGTAT